jgi:hypothetical protein
MKHPPKIISFKHSLQGLRIASQDNILWPCHAFKVSIPIYTDRKLNILEETVLRLCGSERADAERLSEITCLDKEMVSFILNRLFQLGYLSDRFEVTKKANYLLEKWDEGKQEYVSATVYVDLIGGSLLPVVISNETKIDTLISRDKEYINFQVGSTGSPTKMRALLLQYDESHTKRTPTPEEIVLTIKRHKRLHKRFSVLHDFKGNMPNFFQEGNAITVHDSPELIYLNCSVIIQQGNPDFLITEGFGYGFSSAFRKAFIAKAQTNKMLENWISELKGKGLITKIEDKPFKNKEEVILDNPSTLLTPYPEIMAKLELAESNYIDIMKATPSSTSQEYDIKEKISQFFSGLYDALEWTFRQVVHENPAEPWEDVLAAQSKIHNKSLLIGFATKIGLLIPNSELSILDLVPEKMKRYTNGTIEMQPLIALALAGAAHDTNHPLSRLVAYSRSSLQFIERLKEYRDKAKHGLGASMDFSIEELTNYRNTTRQMIMELIPSRLNTREKSQESNNNDIDQLRLETRIKIESYFGLSVIQTMPHDLLEELTKIELYVGHLERDSETRITALNSIASALQIALYQAFSENSNTIDPKSDIKSMAKNKALEANFVLLSDQLPPSIQTVNTKRIIQALNGINTTLGANLLAFLLLIDSEKLASLARSQPDMLLFICRVIEIRGHGNQLSVELNNNEMKKIKDEAYKIIKLLKEM